MSNPGHRFSPHCSLCSWMQLGRTWWRIVAAGPRGNERAQKAMGRLFTVRPGAWTASRPVAVPPYPTTQVCLANCQGYPPTTAGQPRHVARRSQAVSISLVTAS